MIKFQIRRKTAKVWQHFIVDGSDFIFSKCYCKTNGDKFRVVEDGGTQKNEYNFDEIEVYDDLNSGSAETFTSSLELMERLSVLGYVGFNKDGDVVIADLISTDPSNALEEGTDGKLFVSASGGGGGSWGSITGTLSDQTDLQDALNSKQDTLTFTPEDVANKENTTLDTSTLKYPTNRLVKEYVDNNIFDINDLLKYSIYAWKPQPASWYGFTTPTIVGTADNASPIFTGTQVQKATRKRHVSSATSGNSVDFYEGSFRQTCVGCGFFFSIKFANEDAATVANARVFAGLFSSLAVFGNVNPSSQVNIFGVGADTGDANLQLIHNDASGTATKVDLGFDFPANTSATDEYLFQCYNLPNELSSIWWRLINVTSGVATSWAEVTTDLPSTTSGSYINPRLWRNNGTTALAVRLSIMDMTLLKLL